MESLRKVENALDRLRRIEEILKGENPSPEKARAAKEVAADHFRHLTDLDAVEIKKDR